MGKQRVPRWQRLGLGDIERSTGKVTAFKGGQERVLVDQTAPRAVDQIRTALHSAEIFGTDQMVGLRERWRVERHDIGNGEQLVEVDHGHAVDAGRRDQRIARDNLHAHRKGGHSDAAGDATEADHTEHRAVQLKTGGRSSCEALPRPGLVGGQTLGESEQQGQRVFGGRHARRVRGVAHRHAGGVGRSNIDIVVADSRTRDNPSPGREGERLCVPQPGGPGNNAVGAGEIDVIGANRNRPAHHQLVILLGERSVEKEARKVGRRHPADPSPIGAISPTEHGVTPLCGGRTVMSGIS
jgi:hypothetical protein